MSIIKIILDRFYFSSHKSKNQRNRRASGPEYDVVERLN